MLVQVASSVSTSGSYAGYSASLTVDIDAFNEHSSHTTTFGSQRSIIASGSRIEQSADKIWQIKPGDTTPPIPIRVTIRSITDALDPRLWGTLPEDGVTYASLRIAEKLLNLEMALRVYPSVRNAPSASGMYQCNV